MWAIILCFGVTFLILEMMMPSVFFLNFALAAFICAGLSLFISNISILAICFAILSIISIYTLRPLLLKNQKTKKQQSGIEAKYIGQIASVVSKIDKNSGVISIYDERWQARTKDDEVIEEGSKVEIIGNESIVMFVKKV